VAKLACDHVAVQDTSPTWRGRGMDDLGFTIKFSNSTMSAVQSTALSLQHERQHGFECLGAMPRDVTNSQTTPGHILTPKPAGDSVLRSRSSALSIARGCLHRVNFHYV
jgi:hypothetical protein